MIINKKIIILLQDVGQAELGQEISVPKQELGNEKISALTLGFEL
ncbi:MAG: hypothetical protein ABSA09_14250 [Desulfobaccales bacterium]|jgi:hypothetical protein